MPGTSEEDPAPLCPECGWVLLVGIRSPRPGVVEAAALCSRPSCSFGY